MGFVRVAKRRLGQAVAPAIFFGLTCYFGWNATQGDLGLKSYAQQVSLLARANASKDAAIAEQQSWTRRVEGLRDAALDADTIDERARAMLNLADSSEIVVPYGPGGKLF